MNDGRNPAYTEKADAATKAKQARIRQAAFRAAHPTYWQEWRARVGYPTTVAGRKAWKEGRDIPPTPPKLPVRYPTTTEGRKAWHRANQVRQGLVPPPPTDDEMISDLRNVAEKLRRSKLETSQNPQ